MLLKLTKYIDYRIFLYGSIAHTSLYITYFLFNSNMAKIKSLIDLTKLPNIVTVMYFLAHISISGAMIDRVNVNNIGNLLSTKFGVLGHSLLFLYGIFNPKMVNRKYQLWDLLFLFGQISNIILYINMYKYKHKLVKNHYYIFFSIGFMSLFIYYMHSVSMTLDSSFYLAGGLFLVGMLYLTFCINELYKYYIYDVKNKDKNEYILEH